MATTKRGKGKARSPEPESETEASPRERSLWSGAIAFGLVQIPVTLEVAEQAHELAFHQLDRRDMSRIGYERINKTTGKEVPWSEIVKGYEISKGQFVLVEEEDFEAANVEATKTIDIQDFVDAREIPPTFFERPYYLKPDQRGAKPYAVLHDVLVRKNVAAIALVVIRTRQHLCAVLPQEGRLVLELLRFAHELRAPSAVAAAPKATAKELALAEQLVDGMTATWDPSHYKDTYRDDLLTALREKAKTGHVTPAHVAAPSAGAASVTDLVALLQRSVAGAKRREKHAA